MKKRFYSDEIGYMIHQFFKMHDNAGGEKSREVGQLLQRTTGIN